MSSLTYGVLFKSYKVLHNSLQSSTAISYSADFHVLVAAWASSIHCTLQTLSQQRVWRCRVQRFWWSTKSPQFP